MDSTIITALAAVLGSLVGGSATVATTWVTQRTHSKRELLAHRDPKKRETLYGEFISECSERAIDSFERTLDKPETLLSITSYSIASGFVPRTRCCGRRNKLLRLIMEQYFASNLSLEEMRELVRKGGKLIHSDHLPRLAVPS